jgi:hypothetical protein
MTEIPQCAGLDNTVGAWESWSKLLALHTLRAVLWGNLKAALRQWQCRLGNAHEGELAAKSQRALRVCFSIRAFSAALLSFLFR